MTHSPQKYIMPLTLRRVRTTARRTWRHATRLDSISSVVTKMQANASMMLRYSSSIMIWRVDRNEDEGTVSTLRERPTLINVFISNEVGRMTINKCNHQCTYVTALRGKSVKWRV